MPTYEVLENTKQAFVTTTQSEDGVNERTLTKSFNILCTSGEIGLDPLQVEADTRASGQVPAPGSPHPFSAYLFAKSVKTKRVSVTYYETEVNYSSTGLDDSGGSPLNAPAETSFFTLTSEEPIDSDWHGRELKQAGTHEPITGLTVPVSDLGLRASKYIEGFNPSAFYLYINHTNSDSFLGFPPGVCRIHDINASPVRQGGFDLWKLGVEIHFRKPFHVPPAEAWYKRIKAEGFKILLEDPFGLGILVVDWAKVNDEDDESARSPKPVLIYGPDSPASQVGQRLPVDEPAQWFTRQVFGSVAFSSLQLDL